MNFVKLIARIYKRRQIQCMCDVCGCGCGGLHEWSRKKISTNCERDSSMTAIHIRNRAIQLLGYTINGVKSMYLAFKSAAHTFPFSTSANRIYEYVYMCTTHNKKLERALYTTFNNRRMKETRTHREGERGGKDWHHPRREHDEREHSLSNRIFKTLSLK